jgi:hypothetical protein
MSATTRTREAELAARWSAGMWRGATLRSERGETFRVVFEGRRGGGAGPDFRDAVLARPDGSYVYGDIELHLRPAGWHAHGHASDPRYNGLALHVVLRRGARDPAETSLASGRAVPMVVLGEAARGRDNLALALRRNRQARERAHARQTAAQCWDGTLRRACRTAGRCIAGFYRSS